MYTAASRPGQSPFQVKKHRAVNRGGSTALVVGDLMAFDVGAGDAATQAKAGVGGITLATHGEAMWHNIVDAGALASNLNTICCVVTSLLSGAGADNTEVEVAVSGIVPAKVGGTDWSGSDYLISGVQLTADLAGSSVRRMILAEDGEGLGRIGVVMDAIQTVTTTANDVYDVLFFGWGNCVGPVGDA